MRCRTVRATDEVLALRLAVWVGVAMTDKVDRIAEHFVKRVFEEHGLEAGNGEPALHEADPCVACGTPCWSSTRPSDKGPSPAVRVPGYLDPDGTRLCGECQTMRARYPEVFDFIIRNANWLSVRVDVVNKLRGDGNLYHFHDVPVDDENDFPE